jgi:hypothetical protein
MREAREEAGLDRSTYTARGVHVDDHGDWSCLEDLGTLPLHPGFVASRPAVSAALLGATSSLRSASRGPEQPRTPGADEEPPAGADKWGVGGGLRAALAGVLRHVINRRGPPPGAGRAGAASVVPLPLLGLDGGWPVDAAQIAVQVGMAAAVAYLGVRRLVRALSGGRRRSTPQSVPRECRCPPAQRLSRRFEQVVRVMPFSSTSRLVSTPSSRIVA